MPTKPVYHRSQSVNWETPDDLFAALDREFHFALDVCAFAGNAKCERFFLPWQAGKWAVRQDWRGVCWLNPPYGKQKGCQHGIADFVQKAHESGLQRGTTVVCLLPARTDTAWWQDCCSKAEVRFIRGRVRFGSDGKGGSAPFPSAIVVFGRKYPPCTKYVDQVTFR